MANYLRAPCDSVATPPPARVTLPKHCEKWVLTATILGSTMAFIDGTIVNVALPALQNALHASINQLQWVIEAYALTLGALLLVGGALGDLYGRRLIFLIGVVIFTAASIWCGLAPTISQLISARTIQGIGAVLLVPGSLAIISASFSEEKRGQAIGTWAGFTSITSAAGPVVGGWLIQHISWRAIFFLNLPIAVAVFIITLLYVPESRNRKANRKLDIAGALMATIGFGAIVFGFIEWQHYEKIIVMSIELVGICALLIFVFIELHATAPMVPLEMFKSRNFTGANLLTVFLYAALYGVLFFLPLDLIQVQGYSATQAGAALLPLILLIFLLSRWAGGLVKKFGSRLPLLIGPAIAAFGYALFLRSGINDSYWTVFFPAIVVLGLGMAMSIAPLTTVVMNSVPQDHAGAASGVNNAVSRIAGLLAIAVFGLVMTMIFNQQLVERLKTSSVTATVQQKIIQERSQFMDIKTTDPNVKQIIQESFVAGYKVIFWIGILLSLASSLSAALFIRGK